MSFSTMTKLCRILIISSLPETTRPMTSGRRPWTAIWTTRMRLCVRSSKRSPRRRSFPAWATTNPTLATSEDLLIIQALKTSKIHTHVWSAFQHRRAVSAPSTASPASTTKWPPCTQTGWTTAPWTCSVRMDSTPPSSGPASEPSA